MHRDPEWAISPGISHALPKEQQPSGRSYSVSKDYPEKLRYRDGTIYFGTTAISTGDWCWIAAKRRNLDKAIVILRARNMSAVWAMQEKGFFPDNLPAEKILLVLVRLGFAKVLPGFSRGLTTRRMRMQSVIAITHKVHRTYRLVVRLPCRIIFPSSSFLLFHDYGATGAFNGTLRGNELLLRAESSRFHSVLARGLTDEEFASLWTVGLAIRTPSKIDALFRQMAWCGTAQLIVGAHSRLYYRAGGPPPDLTLEC